LEKYVHSWSARVMEAHVHSNTNTSCSECVFEHIKYMYTMMEDDRVCGCKGDGV